MQAELSYQLCAALGFAVFRRDADGRLLPTGPLPQWWELLEPDRQGLEAPLEIVDRHPFLKHFLEDAESLWLHHRPQRIDSGIWEFCPTYDSRFYLQLHAVRCYDDTCLLIFQDIEALGVHWHDHVQRGRESHLEAIREAQLRADLQHELARARDAADRLDRARMEFLANVSHELRTPVASIEGMSELALGCELSGELREYLAAIRAASGQLRRLVNDLLDSAAIESGKLELEEAEFSLAGLLQELTSYFARVAQRKGLRFRWRADAEVPERVWGDGARLRQIVTNLLENACKFTDAGEIVLRVEPDPGRSEWLVFEVEDTGVGIARDDLARVFQSFEQGDALRDRRAGGVGLGLSIAQQWTRRLGGELTVTSETGRGSQFRLTVPMPSARAAPRSSDPPASSVDDSSLSSVASRSGRSPMRILIAEDNPINRLFLARTLMKAGYRVLEAEDGEQALRLLEHERVDLLLLDCHMPRVTGYDVIREIRRREVGSETHLPVLAVTASASDQDGSRCQSAGMDDYLSKPFTGEALLAKVQTLAGARRAVDTTGRANSLPNSTGTGDTVS